MRNRNLLLSPQVAMAKTVVILGGSYAGLHIAHALLKQKNSDLKVILVSKVWGVLRDHCDLSRCLFNPGPC